jgi:hypothetical protein
VLRGAPPGCKPPVEPVELACHFGIALPLSARAPFRAHTFAEPGVLGEPRERGGRKLRLLAHARRLHEGRARRTRFQQELWASGGRGDDDRRLGQDRGPRRRLRSRSYVHAVLKPSRHVGTGARRPPQQDQLPAGQLVQHPDTRAHERALRRPPLDDCEPSLPSRPEERDVDAGRKDAVVPGESLRRGLGDLVRSRQQCIDSAQEPFPLCPPGRVREPLGREEARHAERTRVAEREVGEARQAGLEAVDDVEAPVGERKGEVRAHAHWYSHLREPRDRQGWPQRDHVGRLAAKQCSPPCAQLGCPV